MAVMLHPVNRSSTQCITSRATLLLSYRSSQDVTNTLSTDVLVTDPTFGEGYDIYIHDNAASDKGSYTNCGDTYPLPPGYLVLPVHFMQEATISLPLTLKYSRRQPLNPSKQTSYGGSAYGIYPIFLVL